MPDERPPRFAVLPLLLAAVACGPDRMDPEELEVRAEVVPATASLAKDSVVTVVVQARNPRPGRVRVRLRVDSGGFEITAARSTAAESYRVEFGVRVASGPVGSTRSATYLSPEAPVMELAKARFGATSTDRVHVPFGPEQSFTERFRMRLRDAPAGNYVLVGSFATKEARPVVLRVTP